jgi:ATP-dependent RNA helicase RhlE
MDNEAVTKGLVFTRTKHNANKLETFLAQNGVKASAIHGNKSQSARQKALEGFREGKIQILVASDIAARGIDIDDISHVFNFEMPNEPETYVHRIGRTGRAAASGVAISFCDQEERKHVVQIERTTKKKIPVMADHPFAAGGAANAPFTPTPPRQFQGQKNRPRSSRQKSQRPRTGSRS